jgi:hypothetical protein
MSRFLNHMVVQVIHENRPWFLDQPDIDPPPFVLATRPFEESQPGQLWDVAKACAVPCPQRDQLADELAIILAKYAKLYMCAHDKLILDKRHQVMKALETLRTFLERQGAPRRQKKVWCQLDDLAKRIEPLAKNAYPPGTLEPWEAKLDREWRDWWQQQQQHMTVPLHDAFQQYGPAPKDFPHDSIYHTMAAILEDLGLEPDTYEDLPTALRKRHNKALELT